MSLVFASLPGQAAEITWQSSMDMSGDSDVSTNGELRLAINASSGTDFTVNGVTFQGVANPPAVSTTLLPFQTTLTGTYGAFARGSLPNTEVDELSDLIVSGFWGSSTTPAVTTFTNLVVGQEYEIQVFSNDARTSRTRNFQTALSNGLPAEDEGYVQLAGVLELNNSPVEPENDPEGPEQGDYIIGTFTADSSVQSFEQLGSNNGGTTFSDNGRIHINAIQLRAIGEILPDPDPEPKYWTGLTDGSLDNLTNNFALNDPAAALEPGNLNNVNANGGLATFADEYFANDTSTAVATTDLTIPADAQPTASILSFVNDSVDYTITSTDSSGIVGAATHLEATGTGALTLLGTHIYEGNTVIGADYFLQLGDDTHQTILSSPSLVASGEVIYDTSAGDTTYDGIISGGGIFEKAGDNLLTLNGNSTFTGQSYISGGTLVLANHFDSSAVDISAGATVEIALEGSARRRGTIVYTGLGTLRKSGTGNLSYTTGNFQLAAGSLIEVLGGRFTGSAGGTGGSEIWTNNASDLFVAEGAVFAGVEGNVRFGALTGAGEFSTGFTGAGYVEAVIGLGDASGSFAGVVTNTPANIDGETGEVLQYHDGNLRKVGTGTQTFTVGVEHRGNTVVEDGTFEVVGETAYMMFYPRENATIGMVSGDAATGTGTFTLNAELAFNLSDADLTEGNYWKVIDDSHLAAVNFGENFGVGDFDEPRSFTESSPGIWTLTYEGVDLTFEEASYTLFVGEPFEVPEEEVALESCGFNETGGFEVTFINLSPGTTYQLKKSTDLSSPFTIDVGDTFTGAATNTFVDAAPSEEKAFYQLYEVP
ncbi:autotransporter-associated beta strand repeat-containing protein [Roseibacillus ishigakijimensis]|uniref:Autotransporter-associated beta strand repeat-containing protein n=2 Tax=Roseibacillus ishigakijimensis TaxID=454146 RepID=A0A934RSI2_9BACT|nr:autotransporter-associated beta strand repeat-containing protein [Roseibacillus ishigakijimensis]